MKTNQPYRGLLAPRAMNVRAAGMALLMLASVMGITPAEAYQAPDTCERAVDCDVEFDIVVEPPSPDPCKATKCEQPDPCADPGECGLNLCAEVGDCVPDPCEGPAACEVNPPVVCILGNTNPLYSAETCGPLDEPEARALATIDATHPESGHACTGTKRPIATGSVSATFGGGAVIPASVTLGLAFEVLIAWDFACDYSMFAQAWGAGGTLREVHVQNWIGGQYVDAWTPCAYDGVVKLGCSTQRVPVLSDTFTGTGVAGPGGSGIPPVKMPTEVEICKNPNYSTVKALNRGMVVTTESAQDIDNWSCQRFGIHYNQ